MSGAPLLEVRDLVVRFPSTSGRPGAPGRPEVDGVALALRAGEALGLVGESGSGKSLLALALLRLVPPTGRVSGAVRLGGRDVYALGAEELRELRGGEIAMVFQEPGTALDPSFRIGDQIAEVVRAHRALARADARERAVELLGRVGLPDPERCAVLYPHQLSGGMRQRALIAMAISCDPAVLVADEPTTALDVTVEAGILGLLASLRLPSRSHGEREGRRSEAPGTRSTAEWDRAGASARTSQAAAGVQRVQPGARDGLALLLITHDLAVVAGRTERILVMYAGRIVEEGPTADVLGSPRHPYTALLLRSRPELAPRGARLAAIEGSMPRPGEAVRGCRFAPRCPLVRERCRSEDPALASAGVGRAAACHYSDEVAGL